MLQETNATGPIDVFISHKSADLKLAKQLYDYFVKSGLTVFEADEILPQLGNADYRKTIDDALDRCRHMVVVGSSVTNIVSDWVEAEWGSYINEKRSGRKKGNILTVITANIKIEELPPSLRGYEVLYFKPENFERIAAYVGKNFQDNKYKPPKKSWLKSPWVLRTVGVLLAAGLITAGVRAYLPEINKPYDATFFVKPAVSLNLNNSYPAFKGGELSVYLNNREEKKTILPNQEVVFKQIPPALNGKKVAVKLLSTNWKTQTDSIVLTETVNLAIVPDGSLSGIYGNIKTSTGLPVANCRIMIDTDTTIFTNADGVFKVLLPYPMQKQQNILSITKEGYPPQKLEYFPGSGNIDILLSH